MNDKHINENNKKQKEISEKMCGYCHFECIHEADADRCPLYLEENKDKECMDIECDAYCNCFCCITTREG